MRFATGGDDDGRWVYLDGTGVDQLPRLLRDGERFALRELHAYRPDDPSSELAHPGEVSLASPTTLGEVLAAVAGELGDGTPIATFVAGLGDGVVVRARQQSLRLEAASDVDLAARLARLGHADAARWLRILTLLRDEALTEKHLDLDLAEATVMVVSVFAGERGAARGEAHNRARFEGY